MRTAPRASRRSPSTLEGDRGQRDAAARAQQREARHARAYTCGLSSEPVACNGPWRQSLTQSSVSINTGGRRAAVSPGGESGADRTDGMAARVSERLPCCVGPETAPAGRERFMPQIPVTGTHAHSHIRTQKDAAKHPHARARTCANTMAKDRGYRRLCTE